MDISLLKTDIAAIIDQALKDTNRLERSKDFNYQDGLSMLESALSEPQNTIASIHDTAKVKSGELSYMFRKWTNTQRNVSECMHVALIVLLYATITTHQDTPRILFHRVLGDAYHIIEQANLNNAHDENNNHWADSVKIGVIIDEWQDALQNEEYTRLIAQASQHKGDVDQQLKLRDWAVSFIQAIA